MFCFKAVVENGVTKYLRFNIVDENRRPMFKFDWCGDDFDFVDSKGNQYNSAQIKSATFFDDGKNSYLNIYDAEGVLQGQNAKSIIVDSEDDIAKIWKYILNHLCNNLK